MPLNLELKTRIDSHKKIKIILNDIGAENMGTLNQKDIYYKVPDVLLKLRTENGNESLIFYNRDEKSVNRWSDYNVLKFADRIGENFLNRIFSVEVTVQKKRELYLYDNTRVHLDTVNSLGKFIELETLVVTSKTDAQRRFERIIDLLELHGVEEIRKSYRDLMLETTSRK